MKHKFGIRIGCVTSSQSKACYREQPREKSQNGTDQTHIRSKLNEYIYWKKKLDLNWSDPFCDSFAIKLVKLIRDMSYEGRLASLGMITLEQRRQRGDLIQTYNCLNGLNKTFLTGSSRLSAHTLWQRGATNTPWNHS